MKPIRNLITVLALSGATLLADHHAEVTDQKVVAKKVETSQSRVQHLLEAADHLEAAGAARQAEAIRSHVKATQTTAEAPAQAQVKPTRVKAVTPPIKLTTKKKIAEIVKIEDTSAKSCCPLSRAEAMKATAGKTTEAKTAVATKVSNVAAKDSDCKSCHKEASAAKVIASGDCKDCESCDKGACAKTAVATKVSNAAAKDSDCKSCHKEASATKVTASGDCKDCESCDKGECETRSETATIKATKAKTAPNSDEILAKLTKIEATLEDIMKKMK